MKVPTWREIGANAAMTRRLVNVWPPFLFAGIHVTELSDDWRHATVVLRLRPLTANYVGTQFGGSLFSMTDPFWAVMLMNRLGPDYVVWDQRGEIDFLAPGRTDVRARFEVTDELVNDLKAAAADGGRVQRWLTNDILDRNGTVVARVRRQMYVRRRPPSAVR